MLLLFTASPQKRMYFTFDGGMRSGVRYRKSVSAMRMACFTYWKQLQRGLRWSHKICWANWTRSSFGPSWCMCSTVQRREPRKCWCNRDDKMWLRLTSVATSVILLRIYEALASSTSTATRRVQLLILFYLYDGGLSTEKSCKMTNITQLNILRLIGRS